MNFTDKPPTEPGYYLWRLNPETGAHVGEVYQAGTLRFQFSTQDGPVTAYGGQWCRLMPVANHLREVERLQAVHESELGFYKQALADIASDFGITSYVQLVSLATNNDETAVDILRKHIARRIATGKEAA